MGVARASTQDVAVTKAAPEGTEIRRFDDDASAMQALMSGQVDAIGCSTTVAAQIAKRVPANTFENKFTLVQQDMGIAMRPGQDDLLKTVNEFVAKNTRQRRAEQALPEVAADRPAEAAVSARRSGKHAMTTQSRRTPAPNRSSSIEGGATSGTATSRC